METRLNDVLIDRVGKGENAGYPTVCKGRFEVMGKTGYAIEAPTSLNTLPILPELHRIGAAAIKIEGRQRSPAYVEQVTRIMRAAIDACMADPDGFRPQEEWMQQLAACPKAARLLWAPMSGPGNDRETHIRHARQVRQTPVARPGPLLLA
jgi:putative protease